MCAGTCGRRLDGSATTERASSSPTVETKKDSGVEEEKKNKTKMIPLPGKMHLLPSL